MSYKARILILGSAGQVGTELKRSFGDAGELWCPGRSELDLTNEDALRSAVRAFGPDLILNAAAFTAVDRAESEIDLAMAVNARAPGILAEEATLRKSILVHYSTDYVFDGRKESPWLESDTPNPLNVYGKSKLAGERAIEEVGGKYFIFRTSWVYGPHGQNFLLTILRLAKERDHLKIVADQIGAPTSSKAIADGSRAVFDKLTGQEIAATGIFGIYNMSCAGSTSWFGFAREIFAGFVGTQDARDIRIASIPSAEYRTPAERPLNSVLSNDKLSNTFEVALPHWQVALRSVLEQLAEERKRQEMRS